MSDDEVSLSMPVPLDSDGFLRRECPTCEREFKWLASDDEEAAEEDLPEGGYFCPYCAIQAPAGEWFTQAQIELAQNMIAREVVDPMMKDFGRDLKRRSRRSGGFLQMGVEYDSPDEMDPLTEDDDMTRVDFACHPDEPVKVLDGWTGGVHCLLCGEPGT